MHDFFAILPNTHLTQGIAEQILHIPAVDNLKGLRIILLQQGDKLFICMVVVQIHNTIMIEIPTEVISWRAITLLDKYNKLLLMRRHM